MRKVICFVGFAACLLAAGAVRGNTCKTCYIDYENGNDAWDGTSKTFAGGTIGPWKHAPGMLGLTPSNGSTGDGCSGNCAAQVPAPGDKYILKGGVIWPYTTLPWQFTGSGNATGAAYGCTGTGCIYVGNDPSWNKGIVNSVTLTRDLGGCNPSSPPSVSINGGGGNGATATAAVMPAAAGNTEPNIAGFVLHIAVTNQGSGYSSNPSVTVSGGGCTGVMAVADIQRPVIDAGAGSNILWSVGNGPGATIWGPGVNPLGSYLIFDNLEIRNIYQAGRTTGVITSFLGNEQATQGHITYSNNYIHGRFSNCTLNSCGAGTQESADRAIILNAPTDEASGNFIENGDGYITGTSQTACNNNFPCEFSEHSIYTGNGAGGNIHHNHVWAVGWWIHPGGTGGTPTLLHDNETWLSIYDVAFSAHINELYALFTTATYYNYNNIFHSAVSGASNQQQMGNGTTQYFFNNISWGLGGGTSNYGLDANFGAGNAGGHFYFYNNTIYGNGGTRSCIDGSGSFGSVLIVTLQNNHCITTTNPYWTNIMAGSTWQNQAGSTSASNVQASSTVQSPSTASSQGYTIGNVFAPTSSSKSTVTFASSAGSANLTGMCAGNLTPLCKDINGNSRPTSGGWQAGAYQFATGSTGVPLSPPTAVAAIVH